MISPVLIAGFVEMDGALLYMPRKGLKVKEWFKGKKSVRRPPLKLKDNHRLDFKKQSIV